MLFQIEGGVPTGYDPVCERLPPGSVGTPSMDATPSADAQTTCMQWLRIWINRASVDHRNGSD